MTTREIENVRIRSWTSIEDRERHVAGLDAVFFSSSGTTAFESDEARMAFRERWLGRYLAHFPDWAYLATAADGSVVGYLVGSLEDPARTPLFSDLGYFQSFAELTATYPAQLHVNVSPDWRGFGIGARLVQTFAAEIAKAGVAGVHVVTSRGQRNVRYYEANGFHEVGATTWNGRELVMLGRMLTREC